MQASLALPSTGGAVRAEFQRVAHFAGDGVLLRARVDFDREGDAVRANFESLTIERLNHRGHRGTQGKCRK